MRAYWPKGGCSAASPLQDPPCFAAFCWWKTEYDFSSVREKREMINSACREAVASKNVLSSRICSSCCAALNAARFAKGLSGSVEFCSHLGSATCRCLRNNSSCGKVSSKISCCQPYQIKCPIPSEGKSSLLHSSWSSSGPGTAFILEYLPAQPVQMLYVRVVLAVSRYLKGPISS